MTINRLPSVWAALGLGLACLSLACLAGCGEADYLPPATADAVTARSSLEKALDCWRLRITPDELREGEPAITVADHDWRDGRRLVAFQILAGEQLLGTSIHWPVRLKVVGANSREQWIDVMYIVSTSPIIHISRQD